jgi:hypothetical protein
MDNHGGVSVRDVTPINEALMNEQRRGSTQQPALCGIVRMVQHQFHGVCACGYEARSWDELEAHVCA